MNITILLKIAGVGVLVAAAYQILQKTGREEQATMVAVAGIIVVMLFLVTQLDTLFRTVRSLFGI